MREERLRRKRRRRGESRVEGLESSAVEWTASAARRERVTSIGTRRDFDDREPASESEGGSGVTLVVYSTVGWVVCIIVIVSFQLSPPPLILAVLSLLEITPTLSSSQGKPAISAASGHSNARQKQVVVSEGKGNAGRSQPVHQAQGQRSKARLARPASLSLALVLSHTPLSSLSLRTPPPPA